jgi:hypothetical protein
MRIGFAMLAVIAVAAVPAAASAQATQGCRSDSAYHALDFWVGNWRVVDSAGTALGTNRVESILGGCAIMENWTDATGSEGKSLFYYVSALQQWKQVWVSPFAMLPGGQKEKHLVVRFPDGGVRFQGEYQGQRGLLIDRTTLRPLTHGRVRQLIEVSRDGGQTWAVTFEGFYLPRS